MNIYIGNLSPEVTKEELHQEFTLFGEVTSVIIIENAYTNKYGFVVMPYYSQGQSAIVGLNGKTEVI
jgi:RNA recognition motif-containing protein